MMKNKRLRVLSLVLAAITVLSLLTGCGSSSAESNSNSSDQSDPYTEINIPISSDPGSFDPAISLGGDYMYIFGLTQEGLTRFGDNQVLVDGLAESYEHNEDYTQWTFTLRDSGWNNGDPVTADDWVYGITRLLDGSTDVSYPDFDYEIKNARALFNGEVDARELYAIPAFHKNSDIRKLAVGGPDPKSSKEQALMRDFRSRLAPLIDYEALWADDGARRSLSKTPDELFLRHPAGETYEDYASEISSTIWNSPNWDDRNPRNGTLSVDASINPLKGKL